MCLGVLATHLLKSCACRSVLSCYRKAEFTHATATVARVQTVLVQHAFRECEDKTVKGFGSFWIGFLSQQEAFFQEEIIL